MIKRVFRTVCAAAVSGWMGVGKAPQGRQEAQLGSWPGKESSQERGTGLTWGPHLAQSGQGPRLRQSVGPSVGFTFCQCSAILDVGGILAELIRPGCL